MGRPVLRTRLCDMLGIEYPILSAGMGPSLIGEATGSPVDLVVAVSEAGGLGVLGACGFTVDEMREAIHEIRKRTDKPFGVDLLLPDMLVAQGDQEVDGPTRLPLSELIKSLPEAHYAWVKEVQAEFGLPEIDTEMRLNTTMHRPHAAVKACLEEKIPLFCAGLGNPGFMVPDAHEAGVKVLGLAGNTKNVRRVAQSGVDLVAAQGHEGGGHTGRIGSVALWPQALDAAHPTPVLAAGGIGDGRGVAAALAMGCAGVWVGTRFLASEEGGAMAIQKEAILRATDEDTRRAYVYTGKTSRAIYNRFHDLWDKSGLAPLPFPAQGLLASAMVEMFNRGNKTDYVAPFAGQVSGLIREIKPAGEILRVMVEQASDILGTQLPKTVSASV